MKITVNIKKKHLKELLNKDATEDDFVSYVSEALEIGLNTMQERNIEGFIKTGETK